MMNFLKCQKYPVLHGFPQIIQLHNQQLSLSCSMEVPNEKRLRRMRKIKTRMEELTRRIWQTFPDSVKEFPWKEAEDRVLQQLLYLGKRALKWFLIAVFAFTSLSDVFLAISRNKELIIPLGLFIGCTLAEFLKETSLELFQIKTEEGLLRHFVGMGSVFVLVKFISAYLTIQWRVFLSHVGFGGLMQVFWLTKKLQEAKVAENRTEPNLQTSDAPMA